MENREPVVKFGKNAHHCRMTDCGIIGVDRSALEVEAEDFQLERTKLLSVSTDNPKGKRKFSMENPIIWTIFSLILYVVLYYFGIKK